MVATVWAKIDSNWRRGEGRFPFQNIPVFARLRPLEELVGPGDLPAFVLGRIFRELEEHVFLDTLELDCLRLKIIKYKRGVIFHREASGLDEGRACYGHILTGEDARPVGGVLGALQPLDEGELDARREQPAEAHRGGGEGVHQYWHHLSDFRIEDVAALDMPNFPPENEEQFRFRELFQRIRPDDDDGFFNAAGDAVEKTLPHDVELWPLLEIEDVAGGLENIVHIWEVGLRELQAAAHELLLEVCLQAPLVEFFDKSVQPLGILQGMKCLSIEGMEVFLSIEAVDFGQFHSADFNPELQIEEPNQ